MKSDWRWNHRWALDMFAAWFLVPVLVGLTWIGLTVPETGRYILAIIFLVLGYRIGTRWRTPIVGALSRAWRNR